MGDTFGRPFRDANGLVGRPRPVSHNQHVIPAKDTARSLDAIKNRSVQAEIRKDGKLIIDFGYVITTKIRVNKKAAIAFAEWILDTYRSRKNGT